MKQPSLCCPYAAASKHLLMQQIIVLLFVCRLSGKERDRHVQLASSGHIISLKEIVSMCVYLC